MKIERKIPAVKMESVHSIEIDYLQHLISGRHWSKDIFQLFSYFVFKKKTFIQFEESGKEYYPL